MLKKIVALLLSILLLIGLIGCSAGAQELKQTEQSEQTAKPAQKAPAEDAFAGTIVTMMISQANYQDEYQQIMNFCKRSIARRPFRIGLATQKQRLPVPLAWMYGRAVGFI